MESIFTIVTPPALTQLTTLARVKGELGITDGASDTILGEKIDEASSDIAAACGRELASAAVQETFFHDAHLHHGFGHVPGDRHHGDVLFLRRTPVSAITSVTLDDTLLDPSEYRLDADAGLLYRLDSSGYPCSWLFCKAIVVPYVGGFVLPGADEGRNLPPAIEGAVVSLVQDYWFAQGRDGLVKSETIPGVRTVDYWVGAVGDPELLPQRVLNSLGAARRPRYAVA